MVLKKVFLKSFVFLFSLTVFMTSCENFMNGNDLKDQITEKIEIANAPSASLRISIINPAHGNLLQEGLNDIKIGVPFEISVEPDQEHKFIRWVAFNKKYVASYFTSKSKAAAFEEFYDENSNKYVSDSIISFSNPDSYTTSVTINSEDFDAVIVPLIVSRPKITYSSIENLDVVDTKNKILITFNRPLDPDKILLTTQKGAKSSPVTYSDMTILNPKYAYCMVRPKVNSEESECQPAITYFEAEIDGNNLYLTPMMDQVYFHTLYDQIMEETDNELLLNYYKSYSLKYNPQTPWWISDTFGEAHHDLARQYMDLYFTDEFEDIYGIPVGKKTKLSWVRGTTDKTPPIFLDVRFFHPSVNYTGKLGIERKVGVDNTDTYLLFSKDYVLDNGLEMNDTVVDDVNYWGNPYKRTVYGFISNASLTSYNRIKDRLFVYIRAGDSDSEIYPVSDMNVKNISYNLYKVRNDSLVPETKATADERINLYYRQLSSSMVAYEYEFSYENGAMYHTEWNIDNYTKAQGWDYDQIFSDNKGEGFLCEFNFSSLYEGLYCLELSGTDRNYNRGSDKYNITDNEYMYSSNNKNHSMYNIQYWFYVDKTPPSVTAADFPTNTKWYNAENLKNYYLPYDSAKKLKDNNKGIDGFESQYIQRICKILSPGETWKPDGFEDKGWSNMYVTTRLPNGESGAGYAFDYVYGDESWHPSDLSDGKHTVTMYVKDGVNNITSKIELKNALFYDNTPPVILDFKNVSDGDGSAVTFGIQESGSGVRKVRYSIEDENSNSYDDFYYMYSSDYLEKDRDYVVDTENKIITFESDLLTDDFIYIGPEFPDEDTKLTVTLTLIDNAGNESKPESVILEYAPYYY